MSTGATRVVEAAAARAVLADFEPGLARGADCARVTVELAATERACAGVRLVVSTRAIAGGAHKEAGFADPAVWMLRQVGTTSAQARQALELARSLDAHPETNEALLAGTASVAQAQEIARAEAESPGQEREPLEVAEHGDLTKLREESRERKLARTPRAELRKAQLAARRFRHWRDGLGMISLTGALPRRPGSPL